MNKRVNLSLIMTAIISLNACDRLQPDLSPQPEQVPSAVVSGLRQAFPKAQQVRFSVVEKQLVWAADFTQEARPVEAKLHRNGTVLEAFAVATVSEELPTAVKDYIAATYRGFTIVQWSASLDRSPIYRITLERSGSRLIVETDAAGKLLNRYAETPVTTPATVYSLQLADLPAPIQTYLQGYTFRRANIVLSNGTKTYAVSATKGNDSYLLLFDEAGSLTKSEIVPSAGSSTTQALPADRLPTSIQSFLNERYPGWVFRAAQSTLSNGNVVAYQVTFAYNAKSYTAFFDGAGVLREVKDL